MSAFLIHSMNTPVKESYHVPLVGPPLCPLDTINNDIIPPVRTRHIRTTSGVQCKTKWRVAYSKIGIFFFKTATAEGQTQDQVLLNFEPWATAEAAQPWTQYRCWCYQLKPLRAEVAPMIHMFPWCRSVSLCTWNTKMVDEWMCEQMSRGKRSP